jgi:hypothetical protein
VTAYLTAKKGTVPDYASYGIRIRGDLVIGLHSKDNHQFLFYSGCASERIKG